MASNVLVILGIAVFCGMIGALIFQKLKFPQVVGNIIIGLILGESVTGLISQADIANLKTFNLFALGIIGFLVGGELKIETFKKYAKQFLSILFFEGMFCFFMVGIATGLLVYAICRQVIPSIAVGLVFGAISSATDPASTIDVIWEYRAKGIMTTAIIAVVALDDALAMTLWGISTGILQIFGSGNVSDSILMENVEIGRYSKISKAIIDKNVIIPPYTEIGQNREDDLARGFYISPNGVVVVPKGAKL